MAVMTDTEAEVLAEFREHMIGQRSGDASVIDVRFEDGWDYERDFLRIVLVLADPPPELDFWPHDDRFALKWRGEAEAQRLQITPPFFVTTAYRPDIDDADAAEPDE